MFKLIRIFILLSILAVVSFSSYRARVESVEWKYSLQVNVYPINGDASPAAEDYIRHLTVDEFKPIEAFMRHAAEQYGKAGSAGVEMRLQPRLLAGPPAPPEEQSGLQVMWWSLQFRWWAYRQAKLVGPGPQVRLFVQYFDDFALFAIFCVALFVILFVQNRLFGVKYFLLAKQAKL